MFGSWCLREGAIVLECSNAGQGLKLHREQVEALQPVDNAFRQLDPSSRIELGLQAPGSALSGWLITALDQGEEPEVAGHAPRQRCVLMIGAATQWDRWFQEFLTKMAYHPPKFPTERQTEQLLELAERIASPTQIRKRSPRRGCPLISADIRNMIRSVEY
jgi:hypothetical protein